MASTAVREFWNRFSDRPSVLRKEESKVCLADLYPREKLSISEFLIEEVNLLLSKDETLFTNPEWAVG